MMPHGTRQRFQRGCKCDPCRGAWNRYNWGRIKARRAGDWRGYVSLEDARAHILKLGNKEAVSRISGLHDAVIYRIVNRRIKAIRKSTEEAIMAVTKDDITRLWPVLAEDGRFLPVGPTRKMLEDLKKSGFSDLALGRKASIKTGLRLLGKKYVRAFNARRIEKIYRQTGEAA